MLSPYREWIKTIRKRNEFLKNISNCYMKMRKKFIQFFKIRVLAKKAPCGKPEGIFFFEKRKQGVLKKKGSAKGMNKNGHGWSLLIGLGKIL